LGRRIAVGGVRAEDLATWKITVGVAIGVTVTIDVAIGGTIAI